jgi:hypothetical protein
MERRPLLRHLADVLVSVRLSQVQAGLLLRVSGPSATNPLCSSILREAGLSNVTLARSLLSPFSVAPSAHLVRRCCGQSLPSGRLRDPLGANER